MHVGECQGSVMTMKVARQALCITHSCKGYAGAALVAEAATIIASVAWISAIPWAKLS